MWILTRYAFWVPARTFRRAAAQQIPAARRVVSSWQKEKVERMKYVVVTGGVVSGLGKGVTASSIGVVLKACGLRVTSIKIGLCFFLIVLTSLLLLSFVSTIFMRFADPYLNTDAGTMSPFEHGEVFVLDDGGEVPSFSLFFSIAVLPYFTSIITTFDFKHFL